MIVSFEVDDDNIAAVEELKDIDVVIDASKFRDKRSDRANRYCWKLCDLIAKALGSDKDTIYLLKLKDYGVFEDHEAMRDNLGWAVEKFKVVEPMYIYEATRRNEYGEDEPFDMVGLRCWRGSHTYNTKEMSDFIHGIVNDAQDIGIETWTPDEIAQAVECWKARL